MFFGLLLQGPSWNVGDRPCIGCWRRVNLLGKELVRVKMEAGVQLAPGIEVWPAGSDVATVLHGSLVRC